MVDGSNENDSVEMEVDKTAENKAEVPALWSQLHGKPEQFSPRCCAISEFAQKEHISNNFLKGIKWSPDGLCLLASADDNSLRLFEIPMEEPQAAGQDWSSHHDRMRSVLTVREGETVYDMAWLPAMNSADPSTCCFFSTSRDNPVHVWDAFTGQPRGSYCAYTDAEELEAALSICFDNTGSNKLYCGYNNAIRIYDVERPGREHDTIKTFKRAHKQTTGQRGIVSCMHFNPDKSALFAAGSYSRNVQLYDSRTSKLLYNLQGQRGGVTQVTWSPEGCYLYSGGRKDNEILCWDVRNTGDVMLRLPREVRTNQRLQFDVDASGRYVCTPSQDGTIRVFDVVGEQPVEVSKIDVPCTCVNAAIWHPYNNLIATCTGGRTFTLSEEDDTNADEAQAGGAEGNASKTSHTETLKNGGNEEDAWINAVYVWQQKVSNDSTISS